MTIRSPKDEAGLRAAVEAAEADAKVFFAKHGIDAGFRGAASAVVKEFADIARKHKGREIQHEVLNGSMALMGAVVSIARIAEEVAKREPHAGAADNVVTFPTTDKTPLAAAS